MFYGLCEVSWRYAEEYNSALQSISNTSSNNYSVLAKEVRDNFKEHFNSNEGSVSWQWNTVQSTTNIFDI